MNPSGDVFFLCNTQLDIQPLAVFLQKPENRMTRQCAKCPTKNGMPRGIYDSRWLDSDVVIEKDPTMAYLTYGKKTVVIYI